VVWELHAPSDGSSSITNIIPLTPNHAFPLSIRRVKFFTENIHVVFVDLYVRTFFFLARAEYFYSSACG